MPFTHPTGGQPKDCSHVAILRELEAKLARKPRDAEFARQSGVHEVHISDLERGTREPGLRTLSKIAFALQIPLSELLKGL